MTATGRIFNIMKYSVKDGAGIRVTVFLKGCPLRCAWCHNPESQNVSDDLLFHADRCIDCGQCSRVCPRALIIRRGPAGPPALTAAVPEHRQDCQHCGRCAATCPSGAREVAGRTVTVDEVLREIQKDTVFFDQSGGGVTFSGGEPLLQPQFLQALLKRCRDLELHTAVDTSGYAQPAAVEAIAPLTDLFLYDLKVMDDTLHRRWTGVPNGQILANLQWLAANHPCVVVRVPVVPGVNDSEENLTQMGEFLTAAKAGARTLFAGRETPEHLSVILLPYHKAGVEKYRRLGRGYGLADLEPPAREALEDMADRLHKMGLSASVG